VSALTSGEVQLAQVGTTSGALAGLDVVVLADDRNWQNAENVVPVVSSTWLEDNPQAKAVMNKLSAVLTTADLSSLNAQVDGERLAPSRVAEDYLTEKGLL
jgi:osmoprotectant transport system substrate-binding protein